MLAYVFLLIFKIIVFGQVKAVILESHIAQISLFLLHIKLLLINYFQYFAISFSRMFCSF